MCRSKNVRIAVQKDARAGWIQISQRTFTLFRIFLDNGDLVATGRLIKACACFTFYADKLEFNILNQKLFLETKKSGI